MGLRDQARNTKVPAKEITAEAHTVLVSNLKMILIQDT